MKVKNRLLNFDKIIYQDDEWFKFSLDSVLLSNFVTINMKCKKIMDLCCGNAPIPMLLSYRTKANIDGIELQKCIYDLGVESIIENKLDKQINLVCGDIRDIKSNYSSDSYDTVVCNPPYFKTKSDGFFNDNDVKSIARHEIMANLDDIIENASYLLKTGGNFAMVHRTERFIEIIDCLKKYKLEPKKIQYIYPKNESNSDLFLIEATKNGKSGVKILPGIVIHNDDNSYTEYVRSMFD